MDWLAGRPPQQQLIVEHVCKTQFVSAKSCCRTQVAPSAHSYRPPSLELRPGSLEASKLLMPATRGLASDFWSDAAVALRGEVLSRAGEVQINSFKFADPIGTYIKTIGPTRQQTNFLAKVTAKQLLTWTIKLEEILRQLLSLVGYGTRPEFLTLAG